MIAAAILRRGLALVCLAYALTPGEALACATCFGESDSQLAQGMNMGILSLLGVIGMVLCGVAGFFVFLGRKSAQANARALAADPAETITRS